jgi:AcrR family transcriptional regulator
MIRRISKAVDGVRNWILIPQIQHALLAADLFQNWVFAERSEKLVEPLRKELLLAVAKHDDGWADWDRDPRFDPQSGRPVDFREMPLEASLRIWRRSIQLAAEIGNLAGAVVAGHFLNLLQHVDLSAMESRQQRAAEKFRKEFLHARKVWLARWGSENPQLPAMRAPEFALQLLQGFDRMSLWLCCGEQRVSPPLYLGNQHSVLLEDRGTVISAAPWPFVTEELVFKVDGVLVAQSEEHSPALRFTDCPVVPVGWVIRKA